MADRSMRVSARRGVVPLVVSAMLLVPLAMTMDEAIAEQATRSDGTVPEDGPELEDGSELEAGADPNGELEDDASPDEDPIEGGDPPVDEDLEPAGEPPGDRPNILVIITDDQRSGLGVMPETRRIFRQQGRRFPNAFATTPLCCPSRASIFTGRYAHNHGVRSNRRVDGLSEVDGEGSLPHLLQDAGYRTGMIGKYLNSWWGSDPLFFDEFLVGKGYAYYDGLWNDNGNVEVIDGYSTHIVGERAEEFITSESSGTSPWYLNVSTVAPHSPFIPEDRYRGSPVPAWKRSPAHHRGSDRGKPGYVRESKVSFRSGKRLRARQFRTLRSVDDMIARIFQVLEATGQDRDTLAFFISDNGFMWGEYGIAKKGVAYTPSVKVPMMMRWPGKIDPGGVDRRIVANIDIAPTVLQATDVVESPQRPMDGRSLLDGGWKRSRILLQYWRNINGWRPWASLRTKRWQYIEHYRVVDGSRKFAELYDLRKDPHQLTNLLWRQRAPEQANLPRLKRLLERDRSCVGRSGPAACP